MSLSCSSTTLMSHQSTPPNTHTHLAHPEILQPPLVSSPLSHFSPREIFLEPFCGSLKAEIRSASSLGPSPSRVWQELVPTVFVVLVERRLWWSWWLTPNICKTPIKDGNV